MGVDAGGTKVAAALVEIGGRDVRILARQMAETPAADPHAATRAIVTLIRALADGRDDIVAVGVGAAGMVDRSGTMRFAPNVAWREFPLAAMIQREVGLITVVDNDANCAAWGEFRFGAGRGVEDMLLVTVGTGIGGGVVSGRRLFRGAHGFAGEIGHFIVEPGGPRCGCGNLGCWEQVASGRTIGRLGREAALEHPESRILEMAGGDPRAVDGPVVTAAAKDGDALALKILTQVGRRLGEGIAGLVNILDPEVVVVSGGVTEAGDLLLEPARKAFVDTVEAPDHRPMVEIVLAGMGSDAGAAGAADLAVVAADER